MYKNGFITIKYKTNIDLMVYVDAREISLYNKDRVEYLNFYKKEGLNGLAFENEIYYKYSDIEVLKDYPFIKYLLIDQKNIKNLDGIKYVENLEGLYLQANSAAFDFENVKHTLKDLSLNYHKKIVNLDTLNKLRSLHIEKDIDEVLLPKGLSSLELHRSKRTNLNFLADCNNLEHLSLYANNKLSDIKGLSTCAASLKVLEIDRCKNIDNFNSILQLKHLQKLSINLYDKEKVSELQALKNSMKGVDISIRPELK